MSTFYYHLLVIEDVSRELDAFVIEEAERKELHELVEQILHHHSLNVILNHLPKDKHSGFLDRFEKDPMNADLLTFIKNEIKEDIEDAIKTQADKIKKEILHELKRSTEKRKK